MTHPPLFFYGTLRDPDILAATLGQSRSFHDLILATAPDHAAVYFPDQLYPALVRRIGASAQGLLMYNATKSDRMALDAFEGAEYRRGPLLASTAAGLVEAQAYFPTLTIQATAADWTLEQWTLRHKPLVIDSETAMAIAARQRLSAQQGP